MIAATEEARGHGNGSNGNGSGGVSFADTSASAMRKSRDFGSNSSDLASPVVLDPVLFLRSASSVSTISCTIYAELIRAFNKKSSFAKQAVASESLLAVADRRGGAEGWPACGLAACQNPARRCYLIIINEMTVCVAPNIHISLSDPQITCPLQRFKFCFKH